MPVPLIIFFEHLIQYLFLHLFKINRKTFSKWIWDINSNGMTNYRNTSSIYQLSYITSTRNPTDKINNQRNNPGKYLNVQGQFQIIYNFTNQTTL